MYHLQLIDGIQAIVPTMIIVLSSLGLTTNDLNSREGRTSGSRTVGGGTRSAAMPAFAVPPSTFASTMSTAGNDATHALEPVKREKQLV